MRQNGVPEEICPAPNPLSVVSCQLSVVSCRWQTRSVAATDNGRRTTSNSRIKVAVLGVGSLGREHARIYAELAASGLVQFVGVHDVIADTGRKIAQKYRVQTFSSVAEAAAASDGLSIVTPTTTHYELARVLLQQGKHVLVEKPMTDNAAQAAELVQLSQQNHCVLQVGHVERFNPVFRYLESVATEPRFIETHRLSPYPARSTDIGVVLDLMIHDLDVVLAFVKSPVASVDAVGIPVLSESEDIANARLRFANGCVANLTASRVSVERLRRLRFFQGNAYVSVDLFEKTGEAFVIRDPNSFRPGHVDPFALLAGIQRTKLDVREGEPLALELVAFLRSLRGEGDGAASARAGRDALAVAEEVRESMRRRALQWSAR